MIKGVDFIATCQLILMIDFLLEFLLRVFAYVIKTI